jgi:hypothetical protein
LKHTTQKRKSSNDFVRDFNHFICDRWNEQPKIVPTAFNWTRCCFFCGSWDRTSHAWRTTSYQP